MARPTLALVVAAALVSTACVKQPQNPNEFRAVVKDGALMTKHERRTIPRGFAEAMAAVRANAERCLNVEQTSTTAGVYDRVGYRATIKAQTTAGEVYVQQDGPIVGKPDGGLYILVADIVPAEKGGSSMTVYSAGKGADLRESFFAWAAGKSEACPNL